MAPGTREGIAAARALRREAEAAPPALGLLDPPALPELDSAAEVAVMVGLPQREADGEE